MNTNKSCNHQCQSCGLPFNKDPQGGGLEKDGTKSTLYCSLCYKNGELLRKDCTVEEMQDLVEQKMREQGFGWVMRKLARRQIPHLKRRKK